MHFFYKSQPMKGEHSQDWEISYSEGLSKLGAYRHDICTVTKGQEKGGKDEFLSFSFASAQR